MGAETVNELGYAWRGRLDTNAPYPVEVWGCPECGALVQTIDQMTHTLWHDDRRGV